MQDRTVHILEAAIQKFIQTGEPVSSGLLYKEYDFGIKPAMIRLELDALEDAGYLEQPYHSAGRVPTDTGYEFFADRMLASHAEKSRNGGLTDLFLRHAWADLMDELSTELGLLSVAADLARDMVYKTGLEQLVNHLDWENRGELRSVIRDFEAVDERLSGAAGKMVEGPNVFIGKKSPVTRSENLSVIGENYEIGDATISIFVIGPKRMDYKKVIRVLRNL